MNRGSRYVMWMWIGGVALFLYLRLIGVSVAAAALGTLTFVFTPYMFGLVSAVHSSKILALSFLILVGVTLIVEGFDVHVPKGYIYFAMAFSISVEMLNIRMRKKAAAPVKLHKQYSES